MFICRPTTSRRKKQSARRRSFATSPTTAFRRPVERRRSQGAAGVLRYRARKEGRLRSRASREPLQAILASPQFIFRLERAPAGVKPGQNYRITDIDLASRLSVLPVGARCRIKELVDLAMKGQLRAPGVLEAQVGACSGSALGHAGHAVRVALAAAAGPRQDSPRRADVPRLRSLLVESMQRETELLFETLIHEDRSFLELLNGGLDVRQRAARASLRHPEHHRRSLPPRAVHRREPPRPARARQHPDDDVGRRSHFAGPARQVGDGSADGVAAATAAAQRARAGRNQGRVRGAVCSSVRERMEQHRASPQCNSCHRVIDPLGLALENFDVTGAVAHQGQRRADRLRPARSTTVRRSAVRSACGRRC